MTKLLKNNRGSVPIPAAMMILVSALVISVLLYVAMVQIQTMTIRNAMKTGLANLAVTISADTYTALRESDFEAYAARLTGSSDYRQKLTDTYKKDVQNAVPLSTSDYRVTDIRLDFTRDGQKIRYVCTCDVTFHVRVLGINLPAVARAVQVEGSHTAKYGR